MLVSMRKLPTIPQDFADQLKLVSRGLEESRDFRMKHGETMIIDYVGMLNHGAGPSSYRPDSMHPCGCMESVVAPCRDRPSGSQQKGVLQQVPQG